MVQYLGIPFDLWALTSPFTMTLAVYCLYIIGCWIRSYYQSCSTNLARAARNGNYFMAGCYVVMGADVNHDYYVDDQIKARKALVCAAENAHVDVMDFLIMKGADVDQNQAEMANVVKGKHEDIKGKMLRWAARDGRQEMVRLFLEGGADVDHSNDSGSTALIMAAQNEHFEIVKLLAESGADVNRVDRQGKSALSWAVKQWRLDIVKLLINSSTNVDAMNIDGKSPLIWAVICKQLDIVKVLLDRGANVNQVYREGWSVLMWAVICKQLDIVKVLIDNGADIDQVSHNGWSALMWAVICKQLDIVKVLLDRGANVNHVDGVGNSALKMAAMNGHLAIVKLFINSSTNVDAINIDGESLLIWAASNGHFEIVKLLVDRYKKTINVNHADKDGNTALMLAAERGYFNTVKLLVANGSDVKKKNKAEKSALVLAINKGHYDIAKYLIRDADDCSTVVNGRTVIEILVDADPQNITLFHQFKISFAKEQLSYLCKQSTSDLMAFRPFHPSEKMPYECSIGTYQCSRWTYLSYCFGERKFNPDCPKKPMDILVRGLAYNHLIAQPAGSKPLDTSEYCQLCHTAINDLLMLKIFFTIRSKKNGTSHDELTRISVDMILLPILSFLIHPGFMMAPHMRKAARCLQKRWRQDAATTDTESTPSIAVC